MLYVRMHTEPGPERRLEARSSAAALRYWRACLATRTAARRRVGKRAAPALDAAHLATAVLGLCLAGCALAADFDLVIENGRVIDPGSGFDGVANVAVSGGRVVRIGDADYSARRRIDASGLVVAPGFIDLHAHGQSLEARLLRAQDGVTTALEMEIGVYPIDAFLTAHEGRSPVNYGATSNHRDIRAELLTALNLRELPHGAERTLRLYGAQHAWAEGRLDTAKLDAALAVFREEVAAGALGLGIAIEYVPGADRAEVFRFMAEAAALGVPVFTHVRAARSALPGSQFEMVQEVIANTAITDGSLHLSHVTSKGLNDTALILDAVTLAQQNGLDITTEVYPYTAGSTSIGSALFNEGWRQRWGVSYSAVEWPATGERLTATTFARYRREQPTASIVFHMIPERMMEVALSHPLVMIASDGGEYRGGLAHPRGAGTNARVLGRFARDRRLMSLEQALAKMTIMPARRLEAAAPAMRRKGRLQEGMDADIAIFDPDEVVDRATYRDPNLPSAGIPYVIVNGVVIVDNGSPVEGVYPGKPVRSTRP